MTDSNKLRDLHKMIEEIWQNIKGYEGLYQVSNYGKVQNNNGKFLKLQNIRGYRSVTLYKTTICEHCLQKIHHHKSFSCHRLVLETFFGPCPPGMEGCHGDGNRSNNFIENLRWDTYKNNMKDKIKHNKIYRPKGILSPSHKLNEFQVRIIKRLLEDGYLTQKEIANIFNVSRVCISAISIKRTWAHIK